MPTGPTLQDFKNIVKEADEKGIVDINAKDDDKKFVSNPLSALRFIPGLGTSIRQLEAEGKISFEDQDTVDVAKEADRAILKGGTKAAQAIASLITSGVDLAFDTNFTKKVDDAANRFINQHGDTETLAGEIGAIATQFVGPGVYVNKLVGNVGKLKNIKKLKELTDKKIGKIKNKYVRSTVAGATDIATRAGQGGLSFGLTDLAFSDPGRKTLFGEMEDEKGLQGRELAVARLKNKLKFGQEGALIGAGFPLVGKALSLGAKFGLYSFGVAFDIGSRVANPIVAGVSKAAALDPFVIPTLSKGIRANINILGEIGTRVTLPIVSLGKVSPLTKIRDGLPAFKDWRSFSVNSTDDLRAALKRIDNGLALFRSVGKFTPEQQSVRTAAEKRIVSSARVIEKLLDSLEKKNYQLVQSFKGMYDTKTTSLASNQKYLDEVLEYIKGQRELSTLQKELRSNAQRLKKIMDSSKKEFAKLLPDDSLIKPILEKNLQGYMRKSFEIFTNPNYAVDEGSKIFKDAVAFMRKIKSKDLDDYAKEVARAEGITLSQAKDKVAELQVKDILRYAKTDNKDPIQILTQISRKKLQIDDKIIATGEELPDVIKKLLGEENNLRATALSTLSNVITSSTNKLMFDRLGKMLTDSGFLFTSREAAERALKIAPGGKGVRAVGKLDGIGLLNSKTSQLFGEVDFINKLTNLKGPMDTFAQLPIIKNLLQFKVATQFGKTVLSPATVTRNFTSASMFVLNRGLIGGRASVTESIKMVVDDIFAGGKQGAEAEKRLLDSIDEGIKYGALDENIVASELGAVLKAIRNKNVKDTDELTALLNKSKVLDKLSRVYAGGDNVWKWYAYNWYKSYLKDFSKGDIRKMREWFRTVADREFLPNTIGGRVKDIDEAIKEGAAWYVRNTMPTYSKVPNLIKGIRSVPFFGNFVAFPAEMLRTSLNTINVNLKEIASNDRVLREMGYRGLMGQFITMGGASMGIKTLYQNVTGITQEMMDDYKRYVGPEFQRNSELIAISKMDDEGRFKVVDLSTFMPYDYVTRPIRGAMDVIKENRNTPTERKRFLLNVMTEFFGELLSPFIDRAIYFETVSEIMNNQKKEGGKIYSPLADFPEIFDKSFTHLAKSVEPGLVTTGRQAFYAFGEKLTPTGQEYDIDDILTGLGTGIKPQIVDLRKNTKFLMNDFKNVRKEAPIASNMYKFGQSKKEIIDDFIKQQRFAFAEQRRLYKAFKAMEDMGFDTDLVEDEAKKQRVSDIDLLLDGEFKPLKYSEPRFENKIEAVEEQADRSGRGFQTVDEDLLFPEDELDDVIDELEDADLNSIFPYDITTDPEPISAIPSVEPTQKVSQAPTTPPLPLQPQPVLTATGPKIDPTTGLTQTESALLSPEEQIIRQRQRT